MNENELPENGNNLKKNKNKYIHSTKKKTNLVCYTDPILIYGCEAWTISKQTLEKLKTTQTWFLRRMLCIAEKE